MMAAKTDFSLDNKTSGEVIMILQNIHAETSEIICLLQNLEGYIFMLNKDFQPLVNAIMNLNWLDRGPELIEVYKAFMWNLLSANIYYLKPFLIKLVKKFLQGTVASEDDEQHLKEKMDEDFQHIHAFLQTLTKIVPITVDVIFPLLDDMFPYYTKGTSIFESYTRNILTVTSYIPAIRKSILDLVVKHMLKLDVRSPRHTIASAINEDDTTVDDDAEESMFQMDIVSGAREKSKTDVLKSKLVAAHSAAGSLDAMMNLMFNYITENCRPTGKLNWEATKKIYRELLSSFDKYVLPSHSTNHVQFAMFYICSFKEELAVGFIDYLWKKVIDPNTQAIYRQIGACYIGSFLTRAAYITDKTSKEVLSLMVKWLHGYLDQTSDQNTAPDFAHHSTFYAVCQASFYIFSFKHNQFLERRRDHKWAESLNFQRLVTCRLNPLKICQPIIVQTFSSAARTHQLAFCDTVIERNNRYNLPVSSSQLVQTSGDQHLDTYFPFDPYLLPWSGGFVVPIYKEFQGSISEDAEEDSEDDDDFLPDEEACAMASSYDTISTSQGKNLMDFLHYGTSPGFQHNN